MNELTISTYSSLLRGYAAAEGALTIEGVKSYLSTLSASRSASTVAVTKAALKKATIAACRNEAERAAVMAAFSDIRTPRREIAVHSEKVISEEDTKALMAAASPRLRLILDFLRLTGCRVSEAVSVRLADCRREGEAVYVTLRNCKRGKERRVIITAELFRELLTVYAGKTFLFERETGGAPIGAAYVRKAMNNLGWRTGARNAHPHALRHAFATRMIKAKKDLSAVSRYLGHQSAAFTASVYVHTELELGDVLC